MLGLCYWDSISYFDIKARYRKHNIKFGKNQGEQMLLFSLKDVWVKDIVRYPDLGVESERVIFLCGKSGCGKSTMLKLLNGSGSADGGRLEYCGTEITEYDPIALRREVLLCGQSVYLFDSSIKSNFEEFYGYRELPIPTEERIREYLKVCLADFPLETICTRMSGGERQRVYTAICLSFMPRVLLLDEPTSALDEHTSVTFFENITKFCREHHISLIVVSHNQSLAAGFADEIINLEGR